jgi:hypothetical protein
MSRHINQSQIAGDSSVMTSARLATTCTQSKGTYQVTCLLTY